MDDSATSRSLEKRANRRPEMDRRWSKSVENLVLDIVGKTGSPKKAAEAAGISTATIHDHRIRDIEFGQRYGKAMECAFHQVLGRAFERSLDEQEPSDRLIEVLLKFRWPERLNAFLNLVGEQQASTGGPMGLDPRIISQMQSQDRATLIDLLEKYLDLNERLKHGGPVIEA